MNKLAPPRWLKAFKDLRSGGCRETPSSRLFPGSSVSQAGADLGQLQQRWSPRELLPPVTDLLIPHLSLRPIALPDGKITVLNWQLRQGRRQPLAKGLVKVGQLAQQYGHRPTVFQTI